MFQYCPVQEHSKYLGLYKYTFSPIWIALVVIRVQVIKLWEYYLPIEWSVNTYGIHVIPIRNLVYCIVLKQREIVKKFH